MGDACRDEVRRRSQIERSPLSVLWAEVYVGESVSFRLLSNAEGRRLVIQQFFRVPGDPIPKGRPRTQRPGAVARRPYTPIRTRNFESRVKDAAAAYQVRRIVGPVELLIVARWSWPKSYLRKRTVLEEAFKSTGADADNIAKAIQDALNGIAFDDDRQVSRLVIEKRFAEQGAPPETLVWISSLSGISPTPVRKP